ncbi:MAG: chromate transporter, partial [Oscillospiraceae bacterium]|nr:chromate transporter [Oscillospiraceae bacterium]
MLRDIFQLFLIFFRIGAFTFGGGYAMIPILEREFVTDRGWITSEDMLNYVAIGQSTPGIIAVNMATFIGYRRR